LSELQKKNKNKQKQKQKQKKQEPWNIEIPKKQKL
jgi:hypothetical protein